MDKILVLGAGGQIGTEMTEALNEKFGVENVLISDIKEASHFDHFPNKYYQIDVTDKALIDDVVTTESVTQIYHLAAILSATAEKKPVLGWEINMNSLLSVLDIARDRKLQKIFWPSSIAVFGDTTPEQNTPQNTIIEPSTVYGISKYSGELWCQYYNQKFGVDVRSVRYPGIISWKAKPGGGTTDYAVEIYHEALEKSQYDCFLAEDRALPMMYMDDAIRATMMLMDADESVLSTHMAYNIAAMTFTPKEIAESIRKQIPDFTISYHPDFRDEIARSWPNSIDDSQAKNDWGWEAKFNLDEMTQVMLSQLQLKEKI